MPQVYKAQMKSKSYKSGEKHLADQTSVDGLRDSGTQQALRLAHIMILHYYLTYALEFNLAKHASKEH